jgi:hypothetical protein
VSASDAVNRTYPAGRSLSAAVILHSQAEQRHRRQHWLPVVLDGRFDLEVEVADIVGPLAVEAAALRWPPAVRGPVEDLAGSVAGVLRVVASMLAESRGLDSDARARVVAAVADGARDRAEIPDEAIVDGAWAGALVDQAAVLSGDLRRFLGAALPPGAAAGESASERLVTALREVDRAALSLARRLPAVARFQSLGSVTELNARVRAEREAANTAAALARIGVTA